jgi:hypothetical protein
MDLAQFYGTLIFDWSSRLRILHFYVFDFFRLFYLNHFYFSDFQLFGLSTTDETSLVEMRIWCIKIGIVLVLHNTPLTCVIKKYALPYLKKC